jgi:hypothetical protein
MKFFDGRLFTVVQEAIVCACAATPKERAAKVTERARSIFFMVPRVCPNALSKSVGEGCMFLISEL